MGQPPAHKLIELGRLRKGGQHRQQVVTAVENWWNTYRVTLRDIERDRDTAKVRLNGFLKELGYAE